MSGMNASFVQALTAVRADGEAHDVAGSIRFELNKVYKCVKYIALADQSDADVNVAVGDQLLYSDYSAHTVTVDGTDAEASTAGASPAGIATAVVDGTNDAGKFIWIQIKGPATLSTAIGGTPVIGGGITGSTTDKTFTKAVTLVQQVGTYISATGPEVYLDCPF